MDAALISVFGAVGVELLKQFGASALPALAMAIACGSIWWRKETVIKSKDSEIKRLEADRRAAEKKQLDDALQMLRVAQTGTETMSERSKGDAKFLETFGRLVTTVEDLGERIDRLSPEPPSRPRRRP